MDYYIQEIEPIKDSINKMQNYNVKFITISLREKKNYNHLTIEVPNIPYFVICNFEYRKINGVDVLLIDYRDTIIRNTNKELVKHLVENNVITFKGKAMLLHPPYLDFVFCKNDISRVKCFPIEDTTGENNYENEQHYDERDYYPDCK